MTLIDPTPQPEQKSVTLVCTTDGCVAQNVPVLMTVDASVLEFYCGTCSQAVVPQRG